eukprot:3927962-Prorocentrum_lima.AAC.1
MATKRGTYPVLCMQPTLGPRCSSHCPLCTSSLSFAQRLVGKPLPGSMPVHPLRPANVQMLVVSCLQGSL